MRVVLFGEDAFSAIVLESMIKAGHEVLGVYCPIYDNNIFMRLQKICERNRIDFQRITDFTENHFIQKIKLLNIDVGVVCHFQKILKREIIELPKYGCINLHPSLLPLYRGMSPQHWPIINGEVETGITVHFIDEGIDTGDIILQKKIPIGKETYVFDLQSQMRNYYATIVTDSLKIIESQKCNYNKQSDLKGSYYGRLSKNNCVITENMSSEEAFNLIRGVSYPYFGARVENYIIWKAQILKPDNGINSQLKGLNFGVVFTENGEYIKLYDGILKIEKGEIYEK